MEVLKVLIEFPEFPDVLGPHFFIDTSQPVKSSQPPFNRPDRQVDVKVFYVLWGC